MVSTSLRARYPTIAFMGEETYTPGQTLSSSPTFIVDPIDGTTNFVHGHPYVSISLGLSIARRPVVGVVYNPFTQTLYTAMRGRGAFLNRTMRLPLEGRRALEPLTQLSSALVALEWGSDRMGNDYEVKVRTFARLCRAKEAGGAMVHSARSLGSAALNLCAVAEGGIDAYWEGGCWAWDVCAGWVVLEEAGGVIVDANPGGWEPPVDGRRYLAVRKGWTKEVIEEFWGCVEGRLEYSA